MSPAPDTADSAAPPVGADPSPLDVIVIGAGQAGLSAAGELVRRGMVPGGDLLVLDAEDGPGGAWRHRWDSLTIGRAHRIADLPRFPAGAMDSFRPSNVVVPEYYARYETARGLRVDRPARVTAVRSTEIPAEPLRLADGAAPSRSGVTSRPDAVDPGAAAGPGAGGPALAAGGSPRPTAEPVRRDTLLAVDAETPDGPRTWLTRMVVSAAGTWSHPFVPGIPGASEFPGRQLHTRDYRSASDFAGARVLVVGGGLSAVQMLLEIAPTAASTVWATRRPPNFTPTAFNEIWGAEVEQAVNARTAAGIRPASVVRTTGIPMLPEYLDGVHRGVLVSRGMVDRMGPAGVRFSPTATLATTGGLGPSARAVEDGLAVPESWDPYPEPTWVEADVVFWNTGFRAALSHLAPLWLREPGGGESGIRMDGRVGVVRDPRVLLVGYGSSASTLGATRAGLEAARTAVARLGLARS